MVEKVRLKALDYSRSLPNFICTQVTKRYTEKTAKGKDQPSWKLADTLTIQLSYFEQKENYKLTKVNGKLTEKTMDHLGGVKFKGDFGSVLRSVFDLKSQAEFTWDHWDTMNGRGTAVVHFEIDLAHAVFGSTISRNGRTQHIKWAAEGQIFVDADSMEVLRIAVNSAAVPADSPVGDVRVELDYGRQKVGDREFLLPLRSENWTSSKDRAPQRGVTTFTEYRKFTADSGIKFDAQ